MYELEPKRAGGTRWQRYATELSELLEALVVTDEAGRELRRETGFRLWEDWARDARERAGTLFFVGNGASASMASHISADVGKGARVRTQVFTDVSLMTAVANDISYDEVFAAPLSWSMQPGDVVVAISSSGNSRNVVRAAEVARSQGGRAITLSAMDSNNELRDSGSLNFWVPAETYGLAETTHAAVLHHWVDRLLG